MQLAANYYERDVELLLTHDSISLLNNHIIFLQQKAQHTKKIPTQKT